MGYQCHRQASPERPKTIQKGLWVPTTKFESDNCASELSVSSDDEVNAMYVYFMQYENYRKNLMFRDGENDPD
jgi:hypothetical protein